MYMGLIVYIHLFIELFYLQNFALSSTYTQLILKYFSQRRTST